MNQHTREYCKIIDRKRQALDTAETNYLIDDTLFKAALFEYISIVREEAKFIHNHWKSLVYLEYPHKIIDWLYQEAEEQERYL